VKYSLEEIKRAASKGVLPDDMDTHERVIFYTARYCYHTYKKVPTEATKKRLEEFLEPVVQFHYQRKD